MRYPISLYHTATTVCHAPSPPHPCRVVGNGVLVMSIDHLPAQLPREATDYFGTQLLPFVKELVSCYTLLSMLAQAPVVQAAASSSSGSVSCQELAHCCPPCSVNVLLWYRKVCICIRFTAHMGTMATSTKSEAVFCRLSCRGLFPLCVQLWRGLVPLCVCTVQHL